MTDRELIQQWMRPGAIVPVDINTVRILITALRERLAQQEQEPVAQEWRYYFSHSGVTGKPDEVVGPCFTDRKEVAFGVGCFDQTALYTPPRREWVGLTLEEIFDCTAHITRIQKDDWVATDSDLAEFAHVIEAKLKEKNA